MAYFCSSCASGWEVDQGENNEKNVKKPGTPTNGGFHSQLRIPHLDEVSQGTVGMQAEQTRISENIPNGLTGTMQEIEPA